MSRTQNNCPSEGPTKRPTGDRGPRQAKTRGVASLEITTKWKKQPDGSSGAHQRLPTKRVTPCCWEMSSPMAASMVAAASEGRQLCNHHCLRNLLHALSVAERIFPEFTFFLADAVHVALRDHLPEPLLLRQLGGIATEEPRNGRHHADLDETLLARNLRTLEILKNSYELFRIHMISCEFFKIIKTSFDLSAQFQRTPGIL